MAEDFASRTAASVAIGKLDLEQIGKAPMTAGFSVG